ncbi:MAG: type II secretion system protein GspN [Thermodesulfovibrionales bacterium]|nr:type II secretion system protein GspN [Thermodesulfovibrionales bacterium]
MKILFIIISTPLFVIISSLGIWYFAIPEDTIHHLIDNTIKAENLHIKVEGIQKGLFLSLHLRKIWLNIKKDDTSLVIIENVEIKPDFMSLLKFNPLINLAGQIHGGSIEGIYSLKKDAINLIGRDIKIDEIPSLKLLNIEGDGNLSLKIDMGRTRGEIILKITEAKLKAITLSSGYVIPLNFFNDIRGLLEFTGNTLEIKSLALQGEGIYARISGNIFGDVLDLKMELMPDTSFKNQPILLLIEPFKVSPGYYVIPIHQKR